MNVSLRHMESGRTFAACRKRATVALAGVLIGCADGGDRTGA